MVAFRWSKSTLSSNLPKFRWANSVIQGTNSAPRFRWANSTLQGLTDIALQPIADVNADAGDVVTITAYPKSGSPAPTSYVWRQIISAGDPTIGYTATGDHIVFTVPPTAASIPLTFGVIAYVGTTPSTEVTARVITSIYLEWTTDGSVWTAVGLPAIV